MKKNLIRLNKIIVSLGGVGFIKPASATWGSLVSAIILYFFFPYLTLPVKLLLIILIFVIGTILSSKIEDGEKIHDPHFVVIDELVGMMITTLFISQIWWQFALAFILFRIFDIAKLWPASYFDRQKGGFSTMFDDVLMSLLSLSTLHLILYVSKFF